MIQYETKEIYCRNSTVLARGYQIGRMTVGVIYGSAESIQPYIEQIIRASTIILLVLTLHNYQWGERH